MSLARALVAAALLAGCGAREEPSLAPLAFTWMPIEGSVCGDGSPTGIGIERGPGDAPDVLVFLDGGGACWEALTCFGIFPGVSPRTADPGPFGAERLEAELRIRRPGSILDRSLPGNPYAGFTFVFVPYCTGDVHAGDAERRYLLGPAAYHHRGRANVARAFARLGAELDPPGRVVVAGSSAGGFGALLAFDRARETWPEARAYLVDDSGPPLENIPAPTLAAWHASWDLRGAVEPVCGPARCLTDLSEIFPALAERHPDDRLALLSSTGDATMRAFFGVVSLDPPSFTRMSAEEFEEGVRALAEKIERAPGEAHAFLVPGTSHAMLRGPAGFTSEAVPLLEWLRQQVEDDPGWESRIPPRPEP
jgi:hypothetical protein